MNTDAPVHPKSLRDPAACIQRATLLDEPHIRPLTHLVQRIRKETGRGLDVPFFDPLDAGTTADCIFILQSPGSGAVKSGFVSRDNDDESARHFLELTREAGLDRSRTLTWNAVPWHQEGSTIESGDLKIGLEYLADLFELLPRRRAVILLGGKAQRLVPHVTRMQPRLRQFEAPLPSPLYINRRPENRGRIADVFRQVAAFLGPPS